MSLDDERRARWRHPHPGRAQDCGNKLSEVVTAVKSLPAERVQSVAREVGNLTKTIEACAEFLEKFGEKGFLSRMMSGELGGLYEWCALGPAPSLLDGCGASSATIVTATTQRA